MDCTGRQGFRHSFRTQRDRLNRRIFRQHGDNDLAVPAKVRNAPGDPRARGPEVFGCRRKDVVDGKIVPAIQQAKSHAFAHPAKTDKTDFHFLVIPPRLIYSMPLARACSRAMTAQSFSPSP